MDEGPCRHGLPFSAASPRTWKWQRRGVAVKSGSKKAILLAHAIVDIAMLLRSVTASGVPLSANLARPVALKVIRRLKLKHLVAQKPEDTPVGAQRKLQLSTTWLRSPMKKCGDDLSQGHHREPNCFLYSRRD